MLRGYPLGRGGPGGQPPNQLPPGESVGVCLACVGMCIGCARGQKGVKHAEGRRLTPVLSVSALGVSPESSGLVNLISCQNSHDNESWPAWLAGLARQPGRCSSRDSAANLWAGDCAVLAWAEASVARWWGLLAACSGC